MKMDERLPSAGNPVPSASGMPGLTLLKRRSEARHKAGFGTRLPDLEPEQHRQIEELERHLRTALSPAAPAGIARMVETLLWHYPRPDRSEEAEVSVAKDWLRDLADLPADIIDAACTAWRRSPNSHAPTPGHLLEIARPIMLRRKALLDQAVREIREESSDGGRA